MKPSIVLISPKGAANLGGIARLMANFELTDLRIVSPRCDLEDPECKERSLGAFPIIQNAKIYNHFTEAIADLQFLVALSMQDQKLGVPSGELEDFFSTALQDAQSQRWAFVFGREDNGMEAEELLKCNFVAQIPSSENFPSLNITSSAAIVLYRWFISSGLSPAPYKDALVLPRKEEEEVFFSSIQNLLRSIEFMKTDSDHILDDLRNMYRRAQINDRDLRILFGIVADIGRSLGKRLLPKNQKT